jgi:hypothetical protein
MDYQNNQVNIQELQQSLQQLQSLTQTQHPFATEEKIRWYKHIGAH